MPTKIEWTEETWNPVVGCTKCSPGCDNCYAERMAARLANIAAAKFLKGKCPPSLMRYKYVVENDRIAYLGGAIPEEDGIPVRVRKYLPKWNGQIEWRKTVLDKPLRWRKPREIFVCSMSDLFHEKVPFGFIQLVLSVIRSCNHTFLILTKRIKRAAQFFVFDKENQAYASRLYRIPKNLCLGVSVCNPDEKPKIDTLRRIPAALKFVSFEPLLADIGELDLTGIQQVIVGGESGPGARPMQPDWVRSIRDQCAEPDVPFFFKQWGGRNKKAAGRILDGREHNDLAWRLGR